MKGRPPYPFSYFWVLNLFFLLLLLVLPFLPFLWVGLLFTCLLLGGAARFFLLSFGWCCCFFFSFWWCSFPSFGWSSFSLLFNWVVLLGFLLLWVVLLFFLSSWWCCLHSPPLGRLSPFWVGWCFEVVLLLPLPSHSFLGCAEPEKECWRPNPNAQ